MSKITKTTPKKARKVRNTTQRLSDDHELISTIHHEAAHAICGLLHFMKIPVISITCADKRVEGFTHYEMLDQDLQDTEIVQFFVLSEVLISYAGITGERLLRKELCGSDQLPMVLKEGSSTDIWSAADLIKKHNLAPPGKKRHLYKKKLCRELSLLLREHWDAIKIVSHALYKKRRLTYDDLRKLLIKKSNHKEFWKQQFRDINYLMDLDKPLTDTDIKAIIF